MTKLNAYGAVVLPMKTLRLVLGDQLNAHHSWYREVNPDVLYVLMEMRQEAEYVQHHVQKLVGFFAAMRQFAEALQGSGHQVVYFRFGNEANTGILDENLRHLIAKHTIERFEYQLPDEYRLDEQLKAFCASLSIPSSACDTEHFLTTRTELGELFAGKKQFLMETFYRAMRKKYGILMQGPEPVGGKWNFDHDNRSSYDGKVGIPTRFPVSNQVAEVLAEIEALNIPRFGEIDAANFIWPLNREQAMLVLDDFVSKRLPWFGTYQDALYTGDAFMFHSRLSFALNTKLIHPLEVVQASIQAWEADPERITLNQLEGFIRQIIGWREYMRGIYWLKMPDYAGLNFFENDRKLPEWFWTGKTRMRCMQKAIGQSLEHAYAHHIQRLMVTGNFALLAGIHPDEVDRWYLGIYIDAIEWVEITNTRGMSQFADGGIVGSKPYCSSAAYINKMGNYCDGCYYSHKEKFGERACPFNTLYWHFHVRHREKLERNPRIGMMYKTWDKMAPEQQEAILEKAEQVLNSIEKL